MTSFVSIRSFIGPCPDVFIVTGGQYSVTGQKTHTVLVYIVVSCFFPFVVGFVLYILILFVVSLPPNQEISFNPKCLILYHCLSKGSNENQTPCQTQQGLQILLTKSLSEFYFDTYRLTKFSFCIDSPLTENNFVQYYKCLLKYQFNIYFFILSIY